MTIPLSDLYAKGSRGTLFDSAESKIDHVKFLLDNLDYYATDGGEDAIAAIKLTWKGLIPTPVFFEKIIYTLWAIGGHNAVDCLLEIAKSDLVLIPYRNEALIAISDLASRGLPVDNDGPESILREDLPANWDTILNKLNNLASSPSISVQSLAKKIYREVFVRCRENKYAEK